MSAGADVSKKRAKWHDSKLLVFFSRLLIFLAFEKVIDSDIDNVKWTR